jgi:hypothetical protein
MDGRASSSAPACPRSLQMGGMVDLLDRGVWGPRRVRVWWFERRLLGCVWSVVLV